MTVTYQPPRSKRSTKTQKSSEGRKMADGSKNPDLILKNIFSF